MLLTSNNTVSYKYHTGAWDWGLNYMDGSRHKGWIGWAWWPGRLGYDIVFMQRLLAEETNEA